MINKKRLLFLIGIALIFIIWFILSLIFSDAIVPSISKTIVRLFEILFSLHTLKVILLTLARLLLSLSISFVLALALAILSIKVKGAKEVIAPFMTVVKSVPIVGIIIIILMIVKVSFASVVISSLVAFPILYNGILTSLENIPKEIVDEVSMQSSPTLYIIRKVYLPISLPYILSSVLSSTGLGMKVIVMSEFIAAPRFSIAREMAVYQTSFDMASIYAWILIMLIFVFGIEFAIKKISIKQ